MARETDKRWKGRLIDWEKIAAMDDIDYEFKPLNQQQVAILLALLEYQKWSTRWLNLEMSNSELLVYIGDIEERLMRNEGLMATKDDIRDGIYEAFNRLSAQIVSGRYTNIAIDDTGGVSNPTEGTQDAALPEDDPLTQINETLASKMGATSQVAKAIELLLDKLDAYYGATNGTPVTAQSDTQGFIEAYFPCDNTLMNTAIANYYVYRNTNGKFVFGADQNFQLYLYCHGASLAGFQRWLVDVSAYSVTKFNVVNDLVKALSDLFWSQYYQAGLSVLNLTYPDAACYPSPTEVMILTLGVTGTSQTTWKINHRLRIEQEGYALDGTNGAICDSWWYKTTAGIPVNRIASNSWQYGAGIPKPTINVVPYRTDHKYVWTLDTPAAAQFQITLSSVSMASITYPTPIKVTIIDEGEVIP